ncbi:glycosylated S-layer protein, SlaB [Sulfolobus tengchongensis]|uniref:Glycosylated S-layer protein, SlaB n=1 Tax=Sulfolobus tengchongensis TaxID=207809 RepID=A0AAX4KZK3_9CREN
MKKTFVLSTLILISLAALVSTAVYTSGNVTFYSPSVNGQIYYIGKSITIDAAVPQQFAGDAATINFFFPNSTLAATIPTTVNSTGGIYVPNAYTFPNVIGIWQITVEIAGGVAVGTISVNVTTTKIAPIILTLQNLAMYENTYPQFVEFANGVITAVVMQNGTVNLMGYVYNSTVAPISGANVTLVLNIPTIGTKTFTTTTSSNGSFSLSFQVPALAQSLSLVSSYLISGTLTVTYGIHTVTYNLFISAIPNYLSTIVALNNEINVLKSEIASLNATIANLNKSLGSANAQISNLQSEISSLSSEISQLNSTVSSLSSQLSSLSSQYTTLNSEVSKLNSNISSLSASLNALSAEVASLKSSVGSLTTIAYGGIIAGIIGIIVAIVAIVLVMRRIS